MAGRSDIEIDPEIEELLDDRFNLLSPDAKNKRRDKIFQRLENIIACDDEFAALLSISVGVVAEFLDELLFQYHDFVNIARPLALLRQAVEKIADINLSIYGANAAVNTISKLSIAGINAVIDTASLLDTYQVASDANREIFREGRKEITARLAKMVESRDRRTFVMSKVLALQGKVIDVEPVASDVAPAEASS